MELLVGKNDAMEHIEEEYDSEDLVIRFMCLELICEYELSNEIHSMLCRWAADVLNSCDPRDEILRLLLGYKVAKAQDVLSGQFH